MTFAEVVSHSNTDSITQKIVGLVTWFPYRTYNELAEKVNPSIITAEQLHKRLPELRKRGLVINGQLKRYCTVTHKFVQTWAPARKDGE